MSIVVIELNIVGFDKKKAVEKEAVKVEVEKKFILVEKIFLEVKLVFDKVLLEVDVINRFVKFEFFKKEVKEENKAVVEAVVVKN